ncbi:ApaG domain containing protein [Aphelenchoides avenae]|nr:ApaG domain containing protein [Aphelenchus avenae]
MDSQLTVPFYQVLIHKDDWNHMGFANDMTSYITGSGSGREDKIMTTIQGMDCVEHTDIIPFSPPSRSVVDEKQPIIHDMFFRLFQPATDSEGSRFEVKPDFAPALTSSQKSWLAPIVAHKQTTEGVQVTVVVFYLGTNVQSGQQRHVWRFGLPHPRVIPAIFRYTIRVHDTDKERNMLTLRERVIKVYSLSNMQQSSGPGVNGTGPQLTKYRPAYQFSSVVALPSSKGSHMWGTFKVEREDGSIFEVSVPTVSLEVPDSAVEKSENALL